MAKVCMYIGMFLTCYLFNYGLFLLFTIKKRKKLKEEEKSKYNEELRLWSLVPAVAIFVLMILINLYVKVKF